VAPRTTTEGFVILCVTIAVNAFVVVIERHSARRLQSELLASDAAHTGRDVLASLLVLASFVAVRAGFGWADAAAAALIIVLVLRAGFAILRGTMSTLADERRIPPQQIEAVALLEPGV